MKSLIATRITIMLALAFGLTACFDPPQESQKIKDEDHEHLPPFQ